MSSITFGPPVVLDGPLPVEPPRSLLKIPGVLQGPGRSTLPGQQAAPLTTPDLHWMNGVALWGFPDGLPIPWDPNCAEGTFGIKSDESTFPTPEFAAFVVYLPIKCSMFSLATDPNGFGDRAETSLNAIQHYAVEKALSQGLPMSLNPYLADANAQVLAAGAAVTPEVGMAYLEEAIGQTAKAGMIHATPAAVSRWFDHTGLFDDTTPEIYTPNGTVVVSGGGYAGATPAGEAAAGAGESWAFATGPVRVFLEAEPRLDIRDVLNRTDNDVVFRAERYALVEWDTALQAAVLIDWGT